ncbi:hypothetical protein DOTSEDRAFT_33290 [Dothistroma septosporum NZE10]|uniref:Uncharacterized protein n=1 Tax=Dothistroma septosporum (strain NZE10 / CBS 128990) TaxID=675120 RepID=N1PUV3_DOTSN|nr:hypothetical protein DOTSEDRAFT_33290 [Dothistroma septosporum NZE10]
MIPFAGNPVVWLQEDVNSFYPSRGRASDLEPVDISLHSGHWVPVRNTIEALIATPPSTKSAVVPMLSRLILALPLFTVSRDKQERAGTGKELSYAGPRDRQSQAPPYFCGWKSGAVIQLNEILHHAYSIIQDSDSLLPSVTHSMVANGGEDPTPPS